MQTIAVGVFEAKCLAIMHEVKTKREPLAITKNGKPVARLEPIINEDKDPIFGFYAGRLKIVGDIESPVPARESKRCK